MLVVNLLTYIINLSLTYELKIPYWLAVIDLARISFENEESKKIHILFKLSLLTLVS